MAPIPEPRKLSETQLRHHQRIQAGLATTTATLGLAALGTRFGGKALPRAGRLLKVGAKTAGKLDRAASSSERHATGLLTVGAGLSGVGGYNQAAIYRTEGAKKVSKAKKAGRLEKVDQSVPKPPTPAKVLTKAAEVTAVHGLKSADEHSVAAHQLLSQVGVSKSAHDYLEEIAKAGRGEKRHDRTTSGAVIAGSGATLAAGGLAGGGAPGFKADSDTIKNLRRGGVRQRVGAALSSGRGGVFGYRTDAHTGALHRFVADESYHRHETPKANDAFMRGRTSGKILPEKKVLRELKVGRRGSTAALVGGAALTAYGVHRAKTPKAPVAKSARDVNAYHGAMLGVGATAAAGAAGGEKLLNRQGKKWKAREQADLERAHKVVPGLAPHVRDEDAHRNPKIWEGVTPERAEAAGRLRGHATQARYFSHVYRKMGKLAHGGKYAALGVGAVGAGGLALQRHQPKTDVSKNAFGVVHKSAASFAENTRVMGKIATHLDRQAKGLPSSLPKAAKKGRLTRMQRGYLGKAFHPFDPEQRRQRRLRAYQVGATGGAAAAAAGAVRTQLKTPSLVRGHVRQAKQAHALAGDLHGQARLARFGLANGDVEAKRRGVVAATAKNREARARSLDKAVLRHARALPKAAVIDASHLRVAGVRPKAAVAAGVLAAGAAGVDRYRKSDANRPYKGWPGPKPKSS